jgi:hypothetical protein
MIKNLVVALGKNSEALEHWFYYSTPLSHDQMDVTRSNSALRTRGIKGQDYFIEIRLKGHDPSSSALLLAAFLILNLGLLFEHQADLAKARTMFSKALLGYEQVFGPDHAKSETLRDQLYALDARVKERGLIEIEERAGDLQVGSSYLGIKKPPLISKRHKLFRKLGLRFRP